MNAPPKPETDEQFIVWERSDPNQRPAPVPLDRTRIVKAAIDLADGEGLSAVSIRKVGAALEAAPMRLYGYISTKNDLLELMADEVFGEIGALGPVEGDWRAVLCTLAHRIRRGWQTHHWFVELLGGKPHLGPNALAFTEACYAALAQDLGEADIDRMMEAVGTVTAYAIGAIRTESSEYNAGTAQDEWQKKSWPYLQRQIATGQFPMLERIVNNATHPDPDRAFEAGLSIVLEGLAHRLEGRCDEGQVDNLESKLT